MAHAQGHPPRVQDLQVRRRTHTPPMFLRPTPLHDAPRSLADVNRLLFSSGLYSNRINSEEGGAEAQQHATVPLACHLRRQSCWAVSFFVGTSAGCRRGRGGSCGRERACSCSSPHAFGKAGAACAQRQTHSVLLRVAGAASQACFETQFPFLKTSLRCVASNAPQKSGQVL